MSKNGLHMNDTYNTIFETLQEVNIRWQHMHTIKERISPASVTALARTSSNSKLQTRSLVREGATK
jgi:hypothetical protein